MYYFAYGSNMLTDRLRKRVEKIGDSFVCSAPKYKLSFNKKSIDGSGKANMIPCSNSEVIGVIFDLTESQMLVLDKNEKGYTRVKINCVKDFKNYEALAYLANLDQIDDSLLPTKDYLGYITQGAKEHNLPIHYVKFLERFECRGK